MCKPEEQIERIADAITRLLLEGDKKTIERSVQYCALKIEEWEWRSRVFNTAKTIGDRIRCDKQALEWTRRHTTAIKESIADRIAKLEEEKVKSERQRAAVEKLGPG
jgi:hypothetical protein